MGYLIVNVECRRLEEPIDISAERKSVVIDVITRRVENSITVQSSVVCDPLRMKYQRLTDIHNRVLKDKYGRALLCQKQK